MVGRYGTYIRVEDFIILKYSAKFWRSIFVYIHTIEFALEYILPCQILCLLPDGVEFVGEVFDGEGFYLSEVVD